MLADSRLLNDLQAFANSLFGNPYCIYGDPAYPLRIHLQAPFRNRVLTPQMMDFNRSMSSVRGSVEWLFNDVTNYFKFLDFKKNLKIGLSSVGKMYVVSALQRNAVSCLYGNQTSSFFNSILLHLKTTFPNYSTSFDITFKIGSWQLEAAYALQYPETPPGICVS